MRYNLYLTVGCRMHGEGKKSSLGVVQLLALFDVCVCVFVVVFCFCFCFFVFFVCLFVCVCVCVYEGSLDRKTRQ